MEDIQTKLQRIKKFVEDNGGLFTFENDLKWLVTRAELVEEYKDAIDYWKDAHRKDCAELQLKIAELRNK